MYKTIIKFTAMLILAVAMMTGAVSAQNKNGGSIAPVGFFTGVETSEGTFDPTSSMRWGDTLVLTSYGEWETHHLSVSFNYFLNQFSPLGSFQAISGSWSLIVYRGGNYEGTLYGDVVAGEGSYQTNNAGATSKSIRLNLRMTDGTGRFSSKDARNAIISLESLTDVRSHQTSGNAFLPF